MFRLYDLIKIVSGISTSAPIIGLSIQFIGEGQLLLGVPMLGVGVVAFWLPGWLLDQYIAQIKSVPQRLADGLSPF